MSSRYFLLGIMIGAIFSILYVPLYRRKTKQAMRRYYFEMKDDILENLKEIEEISKETYGKIVDSVVISYEDSKILTSWEASRIKEELKSGYERMKKILRASQGWENRQSW
jgi:gas vesicle protein